MRIISSTPCRISIFGGGTDVGEYAQKYGGFCINMAINIRQKVEINDSIIGHTIPEGASYEFYKNIFSFMDTPLPSGLFCSFDGIIESGLGSSASAAVALVGAVNKYKNLGMTRRDIAEKAWDIEVNAVGLFGGKQDQYVAAFGGINAMRFTNGVEVVPLRDNFMSKIFPSLVMFYTGSNRKSPTIQEGLRIITLSQRVELDKIKGLAMDAIQPIGSGDIEVVGKLLDKSWACKKRSNNGVSTSEFDQIYDKAKKLGAWGGKLLGAGGGGYCIFIVDPDKRQNLIDNLGIKWVDFDIDFNGLDCRILC